MSLKMFKEEHKAGPLTKIKQILGIAAGKGGVGKSSVTVNLALALQRQGFQVGVLDTDIYGPSIRKMLPEDKMPIQRGDVIVPAVCRGIKMISMAYFRKEQEAAVVRAPIANGIIQQFLKQVDWGELDYLLIDFPPGTGDVQLTISQHANLSGAILVTTPQEVALLDVRKAMHMFEQVRIPILGIVENMSYYFHAPTQEKIFIFGHGGGEKLAGESGHPFLGSIPLDPQICACGDQGLSIFAKESASAKAFLDIAEKLHHQKRPAPDMKRVFQKDLHHFTVEWTDGLVQDFRLSDLQRNCPCAGCVDEHTGVRRATEVDEQVKAVQLSVVGRYGIRISFTTGCSSGIFSFDFLRGGLK